MPFIDGASGAPITAISRWLTEKEPYIVTQGGLIALGDQHIMAFPACDAGTEGTLGVQGIGTDDASFDPQRCQKLRHDREFILLLSRHLLFEQQPGLGFIQAELMHRLLVGLLMAQRATQGLAIEGHMHMLLACCLSCQAARFVSTALSCRHAS
jgi:hypothetical protein